MTTTVTEQSFERGSPPERQAGDRRLLGRMVRAVPRRRTRARPDRGGVERRPQARQGEHRRAAGASQRYGVQSIPTMILFKDGEPAAARRSALSRSRLSRRLSGSPTPRANPLRLVPSRRAGWAGPPVPQARAPGLSTRMPCTKTTAPPSQPPSVEDAEPDHRQRVRAAAHVRRACSEACPKIAASAKKTVAESIAIMCERRRLPELRCRA